MNANALEKQQKDIDSPKAQLEIMEALLLVSAPAASENTKYPSDSQPETGYGDREDYYFLIKASLLVLAILITFTTYKFM